MTALFLQTLPAVDVASGEPDVLSPTRLTKYSSWSSGNEDIDVIVGGDDDTALFESPLRVFIDEVVTAEEAAVHEQVERILQSRKIAAVCLQRWWREQSARRRVVVCLQTKLLSRSFRLWHSRSLLCRKFRPLVGSVVDRVILTSRIRSDSAKKLVTFWRCVRAKRICNMILEEGRLLLRKRQKVQFISLQFRRYTVRRNAILLIQRSWRNHRISYSRRTTAAFRIQQAYLLFVARRLVRARLDRFRSVHSLLQTYLTRSRYLSLRRSSTTLQSCLLSFQALRQRAKVLRAVRIVQSRFRRHRLLNKFRNAALLCYQQHVNVTSRSAICIQACWRAHICRCSAGGSFTTLRSNAVAIQADVSRYSAVREFMRLNNQLMSERIHAAAQAYLTRRNFLSMRFASTVFQACFFAVIAFDAHVANIQPVRIVQHVFRRNRLRRVLRNAVLQMLKSFRQARHRSAVYLQSVWRGHCCRRSIGGSLTKLRLNAFTIQAQLRCYLALKMFQRLVKQSQLDSRREALFSQLGSLPDSRDQRLQSLRERFSRRLATIECISPEGSQNTSATLPLRASLFSTLDAKRARLFRIKAQLDMIKGRKEPSSCKSSDATQDKKVIKTVRWCDHHGLGLADSTNHYHRPKTCMMPVRPCIKASANRNLQKKRAQRIMNVLSTTFGKAKACKGSSSSCENSSKILNLDVTKSSVKPGKSPTRSCARRVKAPTKIS